MNKIIAIYDNNRIVKRIIDESLLSTVGSQFYKIYPNGHSIGLGDNIDSFDEMGNRYSNSKLIEIGLLKLEESQTLDGEVVREKTEVEIYNELSELEKKQHNKTIDENDETGKYLREKTIEEKYTDGLATCDEYNNYIIEKRTSEYQKLDGQQIELRRMLDLSLITESNYIEQLSEVQKQIENIKVLYEKV